MLNSNYPKCNLASEGPLLWLLMQAVHAAVAAAEREQGDSGELPQHRESQPSNSGAFLFWMPTSFSSAQLPAHRQLTPCTMQGHLHCFARCCVLVASSAPSRGAHVATQVIWCDRAYRHLPGCGWARHSNGHGVGVSQRLRRPHRRGVEARHLPGRPHHTPCALPSDVR